MNMNDNEYKVYETYRTADLSLIAVLGVLGFPVMDMEQPTDAKRVVFVFQKTEQLMYSVESYWRRELEVEPQAFFDELKKTKARIYQR
jgi:hypothetical protein